MNKVIFLDIDGTLIGSEGILTEKTKEALRRAKANGHILMLCTGRPRCQVKGEFREENLFDGMVASAGAYVEFKGEEIYRNIIEPEALKTLMLTLREAKIPSLYMNKDFMYATAWDWEAIKVFYESHAPGCTAFMEANIDKENRLEDMDQLPQIEKMIFEEAPCTFETVQALVGDAYELVPSSFHKAEGCSGELACTGITKAHGMEFVLKHLGVAREDVIAFGDSYNDVEMLDFAGVGVAMGNAPSDIKQNADMVTEHVDADGLYYGFLKLELI